MNFFVVFLHLQVLVFFFSDQVFNKISLICLMNILNLWYFSTTFVFLSRSAPELSASDLLFLNLMVAASQIKDGDYTEDAAPRVAVTPEERREDDGIELDSSDSGEFCSSPNTPSLGRNASQAEGQCFLLML